MSYKRDTNQLIVFILPYNRLSNEALLSGKTFSRTDSQEGGTVLLRKVSKAEIDALCMKSKGAQHLPTIIECRFNCAIICSKTARTTALYQFGGKFIEIHIDYLYTLIFYLLPVPPQVSSHPQELDQHPVGKRGYAPCWRWSAVSFLR